MLLRAIVVAGCAAVLAAQSPKFAAPVRITAGDAFLGGKRLYPSPVWHDLDGDGRRDLVVGDLPGKLTAARGLGGLPTRYVADEPVLGAGGEALKFHNW
jgi:hypothetical protein